MNEFDKMASKKYDAKEKKKRVLMTGIIICIVLIILLALMIMYYQNVDAHTFKLYLNDTEVGFSDGFYFTNDKGQTYVRAKDIANLIGWSYQNGEYGSYTEDTNSGYIQNEYEVASFVSGSNILKKYIQVTAEETENEQGEKIEPFVANSANGTLENTTLELPIISKDNQIYFPLQHLADICNCNVNYENEFRMYIYDQKYLISLAQTKANEFGYESLSTTYENMRTLGYGMMVVSKGSLYGVVNLYDGSNIIGLKYSDMVFAQNVKEFFVKTNSNNEETIGIINRNGNTVVSPKNYSNINVLNDELGLYLVEKDDEYGVLNRDGDVVVHCEFDNIGIPEDVLSDFKFSVEKNKYLLFDDTLIVEDNGKYGICDTEGNINLPTNFVGFGYLVDEDEDPAKNSEDVLTVELEGLELSNGTTKDVKGIVIKQEIDSQIKYGLYDSVSKSLIIQCYFDRIYSVTTKGEVEYYIEGFNGQKAKLSDQLIQTFEEE